MRLDRWSIAVGGGLVTGIFLTALAPQLLGHFDPEYLTSKRPTRFTSDAPYRVDSNDTAEERATKRERIRKKNATFNFLYPAVFYGGIVTTLISLGTGLVIAFGVGPRWMGSIVNGTVSERFVDYQGTQHFGVPEHVSEGARFYVRFQTAAGHSDEVATSPEVYALLAPGTVFRGRALGSRLTELHSPLTPPDPDA